MDTRFSCICPVTDNEFCHNIVKVVCGSTRLSPCGSTATYMYLLTMMKFMINNRTDTWKTDVNLSNITRSRKCLTTFPSTLKFDKDTPLCVIFSTLFSLFGNVVKHSLLSLIYYFKISSIHVYQKISPITLMMVFCDISKLLKSQKVLTNWNLLLHCRLIFTSDLCV